MTLTRWMVGAWLIALAGACDTKGGDACEPGTEGCSCAEGDQCVGDLVCASQFCVATEQETPAAADGPSSGPEDDANTSTDGSSDDAPPSDASSEMCDRYLACLADVRPSEFPAAVQSYGPGADCWTDAELGPICSKACARSIAALHLAYPDVVNCRQCENASQCMIVDMPACLAGRCAECIEDADCPDDRPYCQTIVDVPVCTSGDGGPSCPWAADGQCDEPEGTGYCDEGTDPWDC